MPDRALRIRRASVSDAAALAEFAARTFHEAFAAANRPEDMAAYLPQAYGIAQQTGELADPDIVTLIVEHGPIIAGYAMLRRGLTPGCVTGPSPVELWRFYVDRPWHGRGVAQRLMAAVHNAAAQSGAETLWLGVWERNDRGLAFYRKDGFHDVGSQDFWVGADRQTDRVLVTHVRHP